MHRDPNFLSAVLPTDSVNNLYECTRSQFVSTARKTRMVSTKCYLLETHRRILESRRRFSTHESDENNSGAREGPMVATIAMCWDRRPSTSLTHR